MPPEQTIQATFRSACRAPLVPALLCGSELIVAASSRGVRGGVRGESTATEAIAVSRREVRKECGIELVEHVGMREHVHLLTGESKLGTPSTVVHGLKLRVSKRMRIGDRSEGLGME